MAKVYLHLQEKKYLFYKTAGSFSMATVFSRGTTDFQSQAKPFELNFFIKEKNFPLDDQTRQKKLSFGLGANTG